MSEATIERTSELVTGELENAKASVENANTALDTMVQNRGMVEGVKLDSDARLAMFGAVQEAEALVKKLGDELVRLEKNAKVKVVNEVLNPMHASIVALFTPEVIKTIREGDVGNVITFIVTCSDGDNSPTINHRTNAVAAATGSATSSGSTGGGTRGRFTWGGLSAADYLMANGSDEIKAHVAKVVSKEVGYNDLSKRADTLAEQLGHDKVRLN